MRNGAKLKVALLLLLSLLGALPSCEGQLNLSICDLDEAEEPSTAYLTNPQCWDRIEFWHRDPPCDCGVAYQVTPQGLCKRGFCSPGYFPDDYGNCMLCPKKNEKWCSIYNKCVCIKNFHRDKLDRCTRCAENEESDDDGVGCRCRPYYTYNAKGVCEECGEYEERNDLTKECECQAHYGRNKLGVCIYCGFQKHKIMHTPENGTICTCTKGYQLNALGMCDRRKKTYGIVFISVGFVIFSFLGIVCGYVVRQSYGGSQYEPAA
ncbi:hypothetical protein KR222_009540 [Zaprionus bogoriensis]|nr:hypothetical protein KR222_009540 [Zaprionus bogoriensis]